MVAALSGIAMRGIGALRCLATSQLPSVIAIIRIGPRLIYKNSGIGLNQTASNRRPLWAHARRKAWLGRPRPSSKSASASRSTAICRPSSDFPAIGSFRSASPPYPPPRAGEGRVGVDPKDRRLMGVFLLLCVFPLSYLARRPAVASLSGIATAMYVGWRGPVTRASSRARRQAWQ